MLRKLLSFAPFLVAAFAATVAAHPLGNFSINQYSRLEPGSSEIRIRQVLDMAEIPTFQESAKIDFDHDGQLSKEELDAYAATFTPAYLAGLQLDVDGAASPVTASSTEVSVRVGAGNLPTLRFVWDLSAKISHAIEDNRIIYRNLNYPERLGWNEIVIQRASGVNVFDSNAFGSAVTDELKAYPQDSLVAPLVERSAEFSFSVDSVPVGAKPLLDRDGRSTAPVQRDKLADLIAVRQLTPAIAVVGLLIAFVLGALHAMSPGHGKTVVGAYLVGSKGTPKHAAFLGLTVTVTHTLGVFALGLITLFASNFIVPERIMPFLSFFSGLILLYIGLTMFKTRLFSSLGITHREHSHSHDGDTHHDDHKHKDSSDGLTHTHDGHTHSHAIPEKISWRSLLALGISGGLLPCPSALVLMLSAISLGRIGYGLVLTLVFSFGLAATLTAVGLIFLYVGKVFGGTSLSKSRFIKALPVLSALVIACVGAVICYNSLGQNL
jgi:nickel/cobalt exporter